ncbi:hypothetical protein BV25DRAFT_1913975 [Artomyces pyxidatus]|uniref:Uncharacterized protein n=1 Tax=Artomyces pyxidatus TaxID=48021 RepID=A0ACB8T9U7_9AGAM|nr:hypothetical protein BV25DRAFT_1913975 [Artomyces pyxidatus]
MSRDRLGAAAATRQATATRRSCTPLPPEPTQELERTLHSEVHNAVEAREYLAKHLLVVLDAPYTLEALRSTLLHIAQSTKLPKSIVNGIHAVSILMADIEDDRRSSDLADRVLSKVEAKLEPVVQQITLAATSIDAVFTLLLTTSATPTNLIVKIEVEYHETRSYT